MPLKLALPGLARDLFTTSRPTVTVDAEGDANNAYTAVLTGYGTWGSPSPQDLIVAARRETRIDAVLATASGQDIQADDHMTVRGLTYVVVGIDQQRTHMRVQIREVG